MLVPNFEFSIYGFLVLIGAIVSIGLIMFRLLLKKQEILREINILSIIFIFSICGAKLLYLLTHGSKVVESHVFFDLTNGFSFFGAIYMCFIVIIVMDKNTENFVLKIVNEVIFVVPLWYSFIRIGCFFSSCCYGISYKGIGAVYYLNVSIAPNGVLLFPLQLVDSILNFILAIYLYHSSTKNKLKVYCFSYGFIRFLLEFFRSPELKIMISILSIDQINAIIILLFGAYFGKKK